MNILEKISEASGVPQQVCASFIFSAPNRYKRYEIPKRNGKGTRVIAQPSKSVKPLQRICVDILRDYLPVHAAALAYESGTGIKKNANTHSNNQFLLKMDFANFFPSITPIVLMRVIEQHNISFTDIDRNALKYLLFWKPRRRSIDLELSIGAPSSPFISNVIMYFFDVQITEYCNKLGITYTRYADDLVFSTNTPNVLFTLPNVLNDYIKHETLSFLEFNHDKTVFASKRVNRHITGVTITNDGLLSIGRARKRFISSMIHKFKLRQLTSDNDINQLKGLLGFANHIEPIFISRMIAKYGKETIVQIQKFNSK